MRRLTMAQLSDTLLSILAVRGGEMVDFIFPWLKGKKGRETKAKGNVREDGSVKGWVNGDRKGEGVVNGGVGGRMMKVERGW